MGFQALLAGEDSSRRSSRVTVVLSLDDLPVASLRILRSPQSFVAPAASSSSGGGGMLLPIWGLGRCRLLLTGSAPALGLLRGSTLFLGGGGLGSGGGLGGGVGVGGSELFACLLGGLRRDHYGSCVFVGGSHIRVQRVVVERLAVLHEPRSDRELITKGLDRRLDAHRRELGVPAGDLP